MSVYLPKIEDYIIDNSLLDELKVNNFLKGRNLKQSHYSLPAICEISTDQRQRKYKNVSQKIIHSKVSSSDGCVKAVKQRPEVNGQVDRPGEDTDVRKKESCSKSNFSYSKQNSDGLHKRAVHRETLCLINTDLTTATKNGSKHDILDDTCRSTVDLHVNKSAVHDAQNVSYHLRLIFLICCLIVNSHKCKKIYMQCMFLYIKVTLKKMFLQEAYY